MYKQVSSTLLSLFRTIIVKILFLQCKYRISHDTILIKSEFIKFSINMNILNKLIEILYQIKAHFFNILRFAAA